MNRTNAPLMVVALMLLVATITCSPPARTPKDEGATETALELTYAAGNATATARTAATATAGAANIAATAGAQLTAAVAQSATAAAQGTPTQRRKATATLAETATFTPDPAGAAALAPITDLCQLVDLNFLSTLTADTVSKKTVNAQPNSWTNCFGVGAHGTYSILADAQGDVAENILASDYAAIETATGCDWSQLKPAGADATAAALAQLKTKYPQGLLAGTLKETQALATTKGCADAGGWVEIPSLGEEAVADHAFGIQETKLVVRGTLFSFTITRGGLSNDDALSMEQKWAESVVAELAKRP